MTRRRKPPPDGGIPACARAAMRHALVAGSTLTIVLAIMRFTR